MSEQNNDSFFTKVLEKSYRKEMETGSVAAGYGRDENNILHYTIDIETIKQLTAENEKLKKLAHDANNNCADLLEQRSIQDEQWTIATNKIIKLEEEKLNLKSENKKLKGEIARLREAMLSVLCDPEGKPCFEGSDGDRKIIAEALSTSDTSERTPT